MEVFQRQPVKWILIGTALVISGCIAISLCALALDALGVLPNFSESAAINTTSPPTQHSASATPIPSNPSHTPSPARKASSTDSPPTIPINHEFACIPDTYPVQLAEFIQVIDGDTFDVKLDGSTQRVRPIGMNTPEEGEPLFDEATQANEQLLINQTLLLVRDTRDDDGSRLLRYVIAGDKFVNYELVRQGWALAAEYPPDTACAVMFQEAQQSAQSEGLGIWSASLPGTRAGDGSSPVTILQIFANGNVDPNEPDEFVELRNDGLIALELAGWTLADKANHRFTFPAFSLQPGQVCRVYTNQVHPESCGFSFAFSETAIWNNGGDCAYLADGTGNLIAQYCY
jgi:endonuclease YncB( thermonuclease family)